MEEKKSFGGYIRKKRLDAGMTQKELAEQLFVTESTISKWERALSYPDVSMVTAICGALGISEHEFFTACDDEQARAQEQAARRWRLLGKTVQWFFGAGYAIALTACLICDLAIFHKLDWFWIVLFSIGLGFCFTNLPFLVRRNRVSICLGAATGCLLALLGSCWLYAGGWWIVGGLAITAVCLALPWGWWAVWRFYGRHILPLCTALLSVWVFALLTVIWLFTGGDWLLRVAFPLAAVGELFLWAWLACIVWLPVGPWLKAGVCALIASFSVPVLNSLSVRLVAGQANPRFTDYFAWGNILTRRNVGDFSWVNILIFAVSLAVSIVLLAAGAVREARNRSKV